MEETVEHALNQIEEMNYDAQLFARGFKKEEIRHYGFAFEGKKILIDARIMLQNIVKKCRKMLQKPIKTRKNVTKHIE